MLNTVRSECSDMTSKQSIMFLYGSLDIQVNFLKIFMLFDQFRRHGDTGDSIIKWKNLWPAMMTNNKQTTANFSQ